MPQYPGQIVLAPGRNDRLGAGLPINGIRGQHRGIPGYGGYGAGAGGMLSRRGFDPLARYTDPLLGRVMPSHQPAMYPIGLRPDILTPYHSPANLCPRGQYPDFPRRPGDDLHLTSRYGPHGINNLLGLQHFSPGGQCDGRGCHGSLGCGCDRRFEHDRCSYGCSQCSGIPSSKDLKTKDILIRGKTYKVRKSFLAEAGKFESEIGKYLEKKSEETVPANVVEMLVDFINSESCRARNLVDLVTLNVLASNLGVKSVGEYSLGMLKKHEVDYSIDYGELTQICVTVLLSSKVDDKLTEWLKKYLKYDETWYKLSQSTPFRNVALRKPELEVAVGRLMGLIEKDDNEDGLRIL